MKKRQRLERIEKMLDTFNTEGWAAFMEDYILDAKDTTWHLMVNEDDDSKSIKHKYVMRILEKLIKVPDECRKRSLSLRKELNNARTDDK